MRGKEVTRKLLNLRNLAVRVLAIEQGAKLWRYTPEQCSPHWELLDFNFVNFFCRPSSTLDNLQVQ